MHIQNSLWHANEPWRKQGLKNDRLLAPIGLALRHFDVGNSKKMEDETWTKCKCGTEQY